MAFKMSPLPPGLDPLPGLSLTLSGNGGGKKPKKPKKEKGASGDAVTALLETILGEPEDPGFVDPNMLLQAAYPGFGGPPRQLGRVFGPTAAGPVIFTGGSPVPIADVARPSEGDIRTANIMAGILNGLRALQRARQQGIKK